MEDVVAAMSLGKMQQKMIAVAAMASAERALLDPFVSGGLHSLSGLKYRLHAYSGVLQHCGIKGGTPD